MSATARRAPVTIVCVFNDPTVLKLCLDRSIQKLLPTAPATEYLPMDNTDHAFPTAGAALNRGARQARHEVVVFAHQDVYLHSLVALEEAAAHLVGDPTLGMLGAVGIDARGELVGRIRDRVVLLGREIEAPIEVDSLDEVLFLASRQRLVETPLAEHPDLAWHAYAVEYGLRARREGLSVAATQIPLTHNSLTINLARLDEAHSTLADQYADQVPLRTTCGAVGESGTAPVLRRLAGSQRWRREWWRESRAVRDACRGTGLRRVVLVDIRRELDAVLDRVRPARLEVLNLVSESHPFPDADTGTELRRRTHDVRFRSMSWPDLEASLATLAPQDPVLVTGLGSEEVRRLAPPVQALPHLVGYHGGIGFWLLLGPMAAVNGAEWTQARARPRGFPPVASA